MTSGTLWPGFDTGKGQILGRVMVVLGWEAWKGAEVHSSFANGHLLLTLVSQGLVSPCSALLALQPHQPQGAQNSIFLPTHSQRPTTSPATVGRACLHQGTTQMGTKQTVLPAPCPGEHHRSGSAKGFQTSVAALQPVCSQQKQDNNSRLFFLLLVILNERLSFQCFSFRSSL